MELDLKRMRMPEPNLFNGSQQQNPIQGTVDLRKGSCLEILPQLGDESVDLIVTSPPYCNRYDYTRTYALELVYLGCNNDKIRDLRQAMLSCTVENKEKIEYLNQLYSSMGKQKTFDKVLKVYNDSTVMTEVN